MTPSLGSYVVVGAVAALVTVLTVPMFRLLAPHIGGMTDPDERRVHAEPTSSLGGGALYLGFLAAVVVAWASGWFESTFSSSSEPIGLVAGATIAYLVGVRDDVREISAPAKTAGLVVAASALVFEAVMTFLFVTVILGATQDGAPAAMAGLAIGLTLAAIHLVGITVTGVSVNPARSFGPALFVGGKAMADLWVFIVAPLAGGALAGILHRIGVTRAA